MLVTLDTGKTGWFWNDNTFLDSYELVWDCPHRSNLQEWTESWKQTIYAKAKGRSVQNINWLWLVAGKKDVKVAWPYSVPLGFLFILARYSDKGHKKNFSMSVFLYFISLKMHLYENHISMRLKQYWIDMHYVRNNIQAVVFCKNRNCFLVAMVKIEHAHFYRKETIIMDFYIFCSLC